MYLILVVEALEGVVVEPMEALEEHRKTLLTLGVEEMVEVGEELLVPLEKRYKEDLLT